MFHSRALTPYDPSAGPPMDRDHRAGRTGPDTHTDTFRTLFRNCGLGAASNVCMCGKGMQRHTEIHVLYTTPIESTNPKTQTAQATKHALPIPKKA